jgi:hypothetical protein
MSNLPGGFTYQYQLFIKIKWQNLNRDYVLDNFALDNTNKSHF